MKTPLASVFELHVELPGGLDFSISLAAALVLLVLALSVALAIGVAWWRRTAREEDEE